MSYKTIHDGGDSNKQLFTTNNMSFTRTSDGAAYNLEGGPEVEDLSFGGSTGPGVTRATAGEDSTIIIELPSPQIITQIGIQWGDPKVAENYFISVSEDGVNYGTGIADVDSNSSTDLLLYPLGGIYTQPTTNPIKYKFIKIDIVIALQTEIELYNVYLYGPKNLDRYRYTDYNVEFNDSVLDMASWKNPRYDGSKLVGSQVNKFKYGYNSVSSKRKKIITNTEDTLYAYGPKPVIEKNSTVLFIGSNIQQGEATNPLNELVEISNHSYVSIDKIIILNPNAGSEKDAIEEIITKESIGEDAFLSFINDNLPEGSKTKIRLLDRAVQSNFKNNYNVKFNKGSLMKIYSYTANTSSNKEDGVFGGYGVRPMQGTLANELATTGLFSFGMTSASAVDLFTTDSIQVVGNFPSELSSHNEQFNLINHLNPITQSSTPPTTTGGDWEIDNSSISIY